MAEVRLAETARRDLVEIQEYSLQKFGPAVADAYTGSLDESFARLREYPGSGVLLTRIKPPVHCLVHRRHRIFYDIVEETVVIRRILHAAMDLKGRLT